MRYCYQLLISYTTWLSYIRFPVQLSFLLSHLGSSQSFPFLHSALFSSSLLLGLPLPASQSFCPSIYPMIVDLGFVKLLVATIVIVSIAFNWCLTHSGHDDALPTQHTTIPYPFRSWRCPTKPGHDDALPIQPMTMPYQPDTAIIFIHTVITDTQVY